MRSIALCALVTVLSASGASAQEIGGYIGAGAGSIDFRVYREPIPEITGGFLLRLADDRVRAGLELSAMTSNGYWSGKGGPIAEFVVFRRPGISPFVRGGVSFGEDTLAVAGGGIDFWVMRDKGIRVTVQDSFRRSKITSPFDRSSSHAIYHQPSVQVAWMWR